MPLPIDSSAIDALSKAEHEYGERLMTLATERATMAGASHVHEADIEWAASHYMGAIGELDSMLTPLAVAALPARAPYRCVCADRLGVAQPGGERRGEVS